MPAAKLMSSVVAAQQPAPAPSTPLLLRCVSLPRWSHCNPEACCCCCCCWGSCRFLPFIIIIFMALTIYRRGFGASAGRSTTSAAVVKPPPSSTPLSSSSGALSRLKCRPSSPFPARAVCCCVHKSLSPYGTVVVKLSPPLSSSSGVSCVCGPCPVD